MSYYATKRMTELLDKIQELHRQARELSVEYDIPFHLELLDADGNLTQHYFEPSTSSWESSNC